MLKYSKVKVFLSWNIRNCILAGLTSNINLMNAEKHYNNNINHHYIVQCSRHHLFYLFLLISSVNEICEWKPVPLWCCEALTEGQYLVILLMSTIPQSTPSPVRNFFQRDVKTTVRAHHDWGRGGHQSQSLENSFQTGRSAEKVSLCVLLLL